MACIRIWGLVGLIPLLAACSGGEPQSRAEKSPGDARPLNTQLQALEQAKAVTEAAGQRQTRQQEQLQSIDKARD